MNLVITMIITKDLKGIVFNIFNYKENDLIVDVLSYQYGFMQLYVRGGQKTTSKSFFIFKIFNFITFDVSKLNLEELSIYKSGSVDRIFDYTCLNYEQMNLVMFMSELLIKIKHQKDINYKKYYEFLEEIIVDISKKKNSYFLTNYFIYNTLELIGCAPNLESCYNCAKTNNIVAFDLKNSGFICKECFDNNSKYLMDKDILNYLYKLSNGNEITNNKKSYDKYVFDLLTDLLYENAGVYLTSVKYIY
ncbi:DNA repair protein RecO (recombination protein O) [Bacilli bacterium PM5-9]|nr:DNA repair protein RecO (recombination protein O) [Bacilli bacterium PM5-9]